MAIIEDPPCEIKGSGIPVKGRIPVAAPIFAKIKSNQLERDNLTALRDALLPKLMSGELDISNIEL